MWMSPGVPGLPIRSFSLWYNMDEKISVEYLADSDVDDALDAQIRVLLTTCFTKPQDYVFRRRRYFRQPYRHRWIIRMGRAIIAHVGVHDKYVESEGRRFHIGGIAEVCVHPDFRGRGYVKAMLDCVHGWLEVLGTPYGEQRFDFAVLFGKPQIYTSSGYVQVGNLILDDETDSDAGNAMVKQLTQTPWPAAPVHLSGPKF